MHTPHNAYATQTVRQNIKNRLQTCNLWQSASNVICRQLLPSIVLPMQTLFGKTFYQRQQKNRLLAKGKKCHVKQNAAVVRNFTLVLRWQRYSGEPAAIRNFQIFRRKMRRAICIVNKDPHRQSTDTYVRHFVSVYNIDTRKY